MYKAIFLLISSFFFYLVFAGPGTHHYDQEHSNYGTGRSEKDHILDHIKEMAKNGEIPELNDENMVYYIFLIHDVNKDGFLDGHELRAALTDFEEEGDTSLTLDEVTAMVDHVLNEDDKDGDGLISWSEYLESQLYHVEDK